MGNLGSNRYDVFPKGSYTIGDTWYVVDAHLDYGYSVTDCNQCGGSDSCFQKGPWFDCLPCPGGYSRSVSINLCWVGGTTFVWCCTTTCCIHTCNSCYIPDWYTRYRVFRYEFFQWKPVTTYLVHGRYWS
ncbi:hypothetical protein [Leptospira alstonii]|uniref:hypothetical protein n=1 Tax=Leptospira alstonii TaxID=28452 RepID=UPI0009D983C3|nr:hypothetical protein [Leptospira alstonii]